MLLMRTAARGPSAMLITSTPAALSSRAAARGFSVLRPGAGLTSTDTAKSSRPAGASARVPAARRSRQIRATFAASADFSSIGAG